MQPNSTPEDSAQQPPLNLKLDVSNTTDTKEYAAQLISAWHPSLIVLLSTLLFAWAVFLPLLSGDLGWHIRVGQYTLETATAPRHNFLCWTAQSHPWLTHEWLSGTMYALIDHVGGLSLLLYTRGALFLAILLLLYRLGKKLGADPMLLCGLILLEAATLALHVSLRPWGFSNLLLVLLLMLLDRARTQNESTGINLISVLLLGLWINLHGGFIVGVALYAGFLVEQLIVRSKKATTHFTLLLSLQSIAWMTLLAICLLQNPHGIEALLLPFRYALGEQSTGLALTTEIKEWSPLQLNSLFGAIWICWLILTLISLIKSRLQIIRTETLLGIVFLLLCLHAQRHLPIAALLLFPAVAEGLLAPAAQWLQRQQSRRAKFWARISVLESCPRPYALVIALVLVSAAYWSSARSNSFEEEKYRLKSYPIRAASFLSQRAPLKLYNHYDHAGLLAWKAPSWPLFITPVNDAYPKQLFADWIAIAVQSPGWETVFQNYDIEAILFPTQSQVIEHFRNLTQWHVAWEEEGHTLLVRTDVLWK